MTATTTALTLALNDAALEVHAGTIDDLRATLTAALETADRPATARTVRHYTRTVDEFRATVRTIAATIADEVTR